MRLRFLLLEDNPLDADVIQVTLMDGGIDCELLRVETCAEFVTALETDAFDLILADYALPGFNGISALEIVRNLRPDVPFIFVSASLGEELAIKSLKRGATDYVLKQRLGRLVPCVQRALREAQEHSERQAALRERQQAEAALRESEEKHRTLFESIDEGFCIVEMIFDDDEKPIDYRFLNVNPAFEKQTGSKNVVGRTVREIAPQHEEYWFERYGKVALTGESIRVEDRAKEFNGWYEVHAFRVGEPELRRVGILFTNITERKQAEEALRESRVELERQLQKFDATLSTITDFVFSFDRDGRFLYANQVLLDLWDLTAAEAIGKTMAELDYPPAVEQQLVDDMRRVFETAETVRDETAYTNPAGVDGYFEYILSPVFASDGTVESVVGSSRNITDRKQVEEALRQSEEQSRHILESITDAFFAVDEDWRFTYVNQTAYTLISRTPGDLIGKIFWEEFPGVNDSEFEQMHRRVMRDRVAGSLTEFYPDHDRWYEVRSYPAVNGVTMYFRNVTDQIQAEAALRQSEEQTRNILESIHEAFFALDENWRFTYVNRSAGALLDLTPGDLIGKNLWEEYPGLIGNELEQIYWSAMRDHVAASLTAFYPDHDRWYEVRTYPASNGITVYFRNVTEQIQTTATLRQSEERYRTLFESIDEGFCVVEILLDAHDTPINYRVLEVNPTFEQQTGLRQAVGKTARQLNLEDHWIEIYGQVALTGESVRFENASEVLNRWFDVYACRMGEPGARKVAIVFKDISDRKRIEAEREQILQREQTARETAERANRIKDEFLAVLSHELRSPLNPILGWTRLLQNSKLNAARQVEALKTIERNAKLQTQLIEDLLDISRIMQGKLSLTVAPVSLTFVISAAIETVRLASEAKNIGIALDLDDPISPVSGDAARLQQVVWNLLTNAVKFTSNGGQVTVELRQLDQLAQIRVIDTGKGINPQFLPHVFEYFRQEDGSTTRKFGGLGLGLAIVRQIVEMHGGSVRAESWGENQGATFIVQLPTMQQATPISSEVSRTQAETESPLDNIQILLVDDETDTREFQAFLLEQSGAEVTAVASGLEALQALEQFIPDVIISDVGMAEMDGYMLMQQIRSRPRAQGGTIQAIALTAYATELDQQKALQAGFQAHMTKPVEPEELVKAIAHMCGRNGGRGA